MIKGQKLVAADGYEVALYPLESIRITQSYAGSTSHGGKTVKNTGLWDVTGVSGDNPKGAIYAPVTMICKAVKKGYASGNQTILQSVNKVHLGNNTIGYLIFGYGHDANLDVEVGKIYEQGTKIGDCGSYGNVTGVHSHLIIGTGEWTYGNSIPCTLNKNGAYIYYCPNAIDIDDAFYTNGIRRIETTKVDGITLYWKEYNGTTLDLHKFIVDRDKTKNQVELTEEIIRARNATNTKTSSYLGMKMPIGIYNILERTTANNYDWVRVGTDVWFALTGTCYKLYDAEETIDLSKYIVDRDVSKHQVQVTKANIKVRSSASKPSDDNNYLGVKMPLGIYDVKGTSEADGYTWIKVDENIYFALVEESCKDLPAEINVDYKEKYEAEVKLYTELTTTYNELKSKYDKLNEAKAKVDEELAEAKSNLTKVQTELKETETKYTELVEKIKTIKTSIDSLI